ncbi:hypothetical protein G6F22_021553 [Rhizopus arrhizus]|nr:hypothetical protein G6F22_021553 [Rhizopus arrhizus]
MKYKADKVPLVVLAGKEYGTGSSRGRRRELRAHPPLQPGRHGRAAAAVPQWRERAEPGPGRLGSDRHHRPAGWRQQARHGHCHQG